MNELSKRLKKKLYYYLNRLTIMFKDFSMNYIASGILIPITIRIKTYRLFGNKIGENCYFSPRCFLGPGKGKLHIGMDTFINYNCWFDLGDNIFIGENCNIAMNVTFVNSTHKIGDKSRRAGNGITKQIVIGNGCWIGANSTILPGVKIGEGTIIGAGSLVLSDCDSNCIYVGRPATKIRILEKDEMQNEQSV